mmetsp:Transcript_58117/g.116791  ORF Transcript_58117/g.116791 Transcript_58117/m.116791 type:complete len:232 (+) Transcript_58117:33-728(+)
MLRHQVLSLDESWFQTVKSVPASVTYSCATNDISISGVFASVLAHTRAQKRQHHSRATYPLAIARAITCGWGGGHPHQELSELVFFSRHAPSAQLTQDTASLNTAAFFLSPHRHPARSSFNGWKPINLFSRTVSLSLAPIETNQEPKTSAHHGAFDSRKYQATSLRHCSMHVPPNTSFIFLPPPQLTPQPTYLHISHAKLRAHSRPYSSILRPSQTSLFSANPNSFMSPHF